ncbi:MAG: hypothetical protein AAF732_09885 [Pseudomonadota bacterium]
MRSLIAAVCLAITCGTASSALAATLRGTWVGSGYFKPGSGPSERVRCRVTYSPRTRRVIGVVARCASASGTLRQTGELLKIRENRYVGDFYNAQFNVRGRVRVTISGRRQTVVFVGDGGAGRLRLRRR